MGSMDLSLVIPTLNEAESLGSLVAALTSELDARLGEAYEIIVVDDGSTDGTEQIATALASVYPTVRLLQRPGRGLATAVVYGWQQAEGRVLAVMDGDLQHPPPVLMQLFDALEQGATLAVASRYQSSSTADWRGSRRSLSHLAQQLGAMLLPSVFAQLSDPLSGYFALRRELVQGRSLNPVGYKILIEVVARSGIRRSNIAEVGYHFGQRRAGQSKATVRQALSYLCHLVRLRLALWQRKAIAPRRFSSSTVVTCRPQKQVSQKLVPRKTPLQEPAARNLP